MSSAATSLSSGCAFCTAASVTPRSECSLPITTIESVALRPIMSMLTLATICVGRDGRMVGVPRRAEQPLLLARDVQDDHRALRLHLQLAPGLGDHQQAGGAGGVVVGAVADVVDAAVGAREGGAAADAVARRADVVHVAREDHVLRSSTSGPTLRPSRRRSAP